VIDAEEVLRLMENNITADNNGINTDCTDEGVIIMHTVHFYCSSDIIPEEMHKNITKPVAKKADCS
jgi:hypothetical protein